MTQSLATSKYFEINGIKDKVVINPKWIGYHVVSMQKTAVQEGRLKYMDVGKI